ncbi:hypothetical protein LCGC14_2765170, partial [marine sediment metagenome]
MKKAGPLPRIEQGKHNIFNGLVKRKFETKLRIIPMLNNTIMYINQAPQLSIGSVRVGVGQPVPA